MHQSINEVLKRLDTQPILVDVGASGSPPKVWGSIASHSSYIGFDPDLRELYDIKEGQFARSIIINKAVTNAVDTGKVRFYLTHSPFCSSTLPPDTMSLSNYLFSDLFVVEREVAVPVSTLSTVLEQLGVHKIDWFKTDSQGTDLQLFQSLPDDMRSRVLAVDIEPGLIDAYQGEDLFVDAHRELVRQGYWLASLEVQGSVRMRRTSLQSIASHYSRLTDNDIYQAVRRSPSWCETTYLRTIESLDQRNADSRDYALLWVFAMVLQQWGYALDIACAYKQKFVHDPISSLLRDLPLQLIIAKNRNTRVRLLPHQIKQNMRVVLGRLLPHQIKRFLKQLTMWKHS